MAESRALEPVEDDWRDLAQTTVEYLTGVLRALPDAPASIFDGVPELLEDPALARHPAEHGRPLTELLEILDRAASVGLNTASPGYLGFIPGSGIVSAGLADLIGDVLNRYTGFAFPSPGLVAIEAHLLRWLADLYDFPPEAGGFLTSGGSLATFSALVAARHDKLPENFLNGTVYVSDQVHQAVVKAARLAGFPVSAVRTVPTNPNLQIDLAALADSIQADRSAGRQPFCVVASAGTTNTGAIDPLPAIADLCAAEGLWLHVDGAYGAAFVLTERGRERLVGIERANSLVLDPHKGFFLPFGSGCLLVRDRATLRASHSGETADYLQDVTGSDLPDFAVLGPELTREFRGLRLWLPLHLHGVAAFRDALDEKLDLANAAYLELSADPDLHILTPPPLTTIAFRCRLPGGDEAGEDEATAELLRRVNAERRVFMSSTRIAGRFTARMCILNHRTDSARVAEAIASIRTHAAALVDRAAG